MWERFYSIHLHMAHVRMHMSMCVMCMHMSKSMWMCILYVHRHIMCMSHV